MDVSIASGLEVYVAIMTTLILVVMLIRRAP